MRKRDRLGCWQQLLTLLGIHSRSEKEWIRLYRDFLRSWKRIYYLQLDQNALLAADVNPLIERHDVTAPPADPGSHHYAMAPPSVPYVIPVKRRNSVAPPSGTLVSSIKRRYSVASPSGPLINTIKRRNSVASPVSPSFSPIKRRNSLASPSVSSIKRRNSLAPPSVSALSRKNSWVPPDFDTDPLLTTIKRSDSVIPGIELIDYDDFNSPIKRRDSMAFDEWLKPIECISPLAASPIKHRDSLASDEGMNCKEFVTLLPPISIKRRDSLATAPPKAKPKSSQRKPLKKPMSVVKHVTGSGDELDDEMSLSTWKEYIDQRKALNMKPFESPEHKFPPQKVPTTIVKVEPPVKRKRGRPSREEKARRLLEEQALKMQQAVAPLKESPKKNSTLDLMKQDLDQKPSQNAESLKNQSRASQPTTVGLTKSQKNSKATKQKPTAKARCQSGSSVSEQEERNIATLSNVVVEHAILDDNAVPPAHMPPVALDLKSPSKVPPANNEEEKEDKEGKSQEQDKVRQKANGSNKKNGRSLYKRILGSLSTDEVEDASALLQETGFVANDFEAEERLLDDVMDLTSPVGGEEGDKDTLDFDLDLLVRDDNVANRIALIDPQSEVSFDQCLQAIDNKPPSEQSDECVETLSPKRAPSAIDHQLSHTSEFFEKLSSRSPVDVNADKSNLLWPYLDEDEVLDYEADYDVLTLVVSSDELEDESKEATKPSENSESRNQNNENAESQNQVNIPNVQEVAPPQPELQPKPIDKAASPNADNLRSFRIPRINPELLKAQPSVMHSLYLQEDKEPSRKKTKPVVTPPLSEDVRKRREEARAARRPKEAMPRFAPPFRNTREEEESLPEDLSQPMFGPQDLAPPMFGPDDLAPICAPPSEGQGINYRQPLAAASNYASDISFIQNTNPIGNRNFPPEMAPQRQEPNYLQPRGSSQYAPETFIPNSDPLGNRHPTGASQYVPQNLASSKRKAPTAEMSTPSHQNWMMEVFGAKCLKYLDNKCLAPNCDHEMSSVGEVERRLLSMPEESLDKTYRQALRSFHIFERYFKCFANIFERRKLHKHLLQMLANSRLYRNIAVPIVRHVFPALQRFGLEREATACMMTDLWRPEKAHKFSELTSAILKILEESNWQDYIDQLVVLHETYKFLLSDEFMIRIMNWADVTKNEALQKKAMMMLLADSATYARSTVLMGLVDKFSNSEPKPNLPQRSPAQQPPQYATPNWKHNTITNQIPSLLPDRLPGAGSSPSLIRRSPANGLPPYSVPNWNHNSSINAILVPQLERLPGAVPLPSLIRSNPAQTPGAGSSPSLIRRSPANGLPPQYSVSNWNHNPNINPILIPQHKVLPGAGPGPSLQQSSPLAGQHKEQQEYSATNWRISNINRADDNAFSNYTAGFQ